MSEKRYELLRIVVAPLTSVILAVIAAVNVTAHKAEELGVKFAGTVEWSSGEEPKLTQVRGDVEIEIDEEMPYDVILRFKNPRFANPLPTVIATGVTIQNKNKTPGYATYVTVVRIS